MKFHHAIFFISLVCSSVGCAGPAISNSNAAGTQSDLIRTKAGEYLGRLGDNSSGAKINDITLLGLNWYRIRFTPGGEKMGGPDYHLLIMNTDGRLLHIDSAGRVVSADPVRTQQIMAEIAGPMNGDGDYARCVYLYLKIWRPEETVMINRLRDIPEYDDHPLPPDLAGAVRGPWSERIEKGARYTCYTYRRAGGLVERWEFVFQDGMYSGCDSIRIHGNVGGAFWYE